MSGLTVEQHLEILEESRRISFPYIEELGLQEQHRQVIAKRAELEGIQQEDWALVSAARIWADRWGIDLSTAPTQLWPDQPDPPTSSDDNSSETPPSDPYYGSPLGEDLNFPGRQS